MNITYYECPLTSILENTCMQGDSGSPLAVSDGAGRWSAVGVVSWRTAAGSPGGG